MKTNNIIKILIPVFILLLMTCKKDEKARDSYLVQQTEYFDAQKDSVDVVPYEIEDVIDVNAYD